MADTTPGLRHLPAHLSEPYRERRYVVFAYWTDAGWWRREGNYATLEQAQRVADAHNGQGRAVIVAQQDVTYGPHLPVTGASGAEPAALVTASRTDRQPRDSATNAKGGQGPGDLDA